VGRIWFIIEHQSRGWMVKQYPRPAFKWSILRSDRQVLRFASPAKAQRIAGAIRGAHVLQLDGRL
jgi:hypothetical protein